MATNKKCPHCGGITFRAMIKHPGLVSVDTDGNFTILSEATTKQVFEVVQCQDCKANVTEQELSSKICSACGQVILHGDLNAEGKCTACVAMEKDKDLANASKEEILRLYLEAQKGNQKTFTQMADEKISANTASTTRKSEVKTTIETTDDSSEVKTEEPTTTRRKRRTKSEMEAANTTEEPVVDPTPEEPNPEEIGDAPNLPTKEEFFPTKEDDLPPTDSKEAEMPIPESSEEAPFPNPEDLFNPAAAQAPAEVSTPVTPAPTAGFPMFAEEESF